MKSIKLTYLLIGALALTMAATGCKHKPVGVTPLPGARVGPPGGGAPSPLPSGPAVAGEAAPQGITQPGGGTLPDLGDIDNNYTQDRAALAAHTIHFDFDSSVIKSNDRGNIEAVAAYMKSTPNVALLIEGNCDERGTEEYNRALGERRALAAREALVGLGVDGGKITTRSYGEDRPVDPGHNEAAWAKNRRDDFVVLHPK